MTEADQRLLEAIFHVEGIACDAKLYRDRIVWRHVSASSSVDRDVGADGVLISKTGGSVRLEHCLSVGNAVKNGQKIGFELTSFVESAGDGRFLMKLVRFLQANHDVLNQWTKAIKYLLSGILRPNNIHVFLQPFAGRHEGRRILHEKVIPLLNCTGVQFEETDVSKVDDMKAMVASLDLDRISGFVIVGGDGTTSRVITALLDRAQQLNNVNKVLEATAPAEAFTPVRLNAPVCLVPAGLTNQSAFTSAGCLDPTTAVINFLLGYWLPVNVCSVWAQTVEPVAPSEETRVKQTDRVQQTFVGWHWAGHYGFAANALSYADRYHYFGPDRVRVSFLKALTSSKLRAYDCHIQYVKTDSSCGSPKDGQKCRWRCSRCLDNPVLMQKADPATATRISRQASVSESLGEPEVDSVHEFDPLALSGTSSVLGGLKSARTDLSDAAELDSSRDGPSSLAAGSCPLQYSSVNGTFINVSVLSMPMMCELAPLGLSRYSHLNDGYVDVLLIHATERKQFLRYLKRLMLAEKRPLDLPFVEAVRTKEVLIRPRDSHWQHFNLAGSDRIVVRSSAGHDPLETELTAATKQHAGTSFGVSRTASGAATETPHAYQNPAADLVLSSDSDVESAGVEVDVAQHLDRLSTRTDSLDARSAAVGLSKGEKYRLKRRKKQRKQLENRQEREKRKAVSSWNLDQTLQPAVPLRFVAHASLVRLAGRGRLSTRDESEVHSKLNCFPVF